MEESTSEFGSVVFKYSKNGLEADKLELLSICLTVVRVEASPFSRSQPSQKNRNSSSSQAGDKDFIYHEKYSFRSQGNSGLDIHISGCVQIKIYLNIREKKLLIKEILQTDTDHSRTLKTKEHIHSGIIDSGIGTQFKKLADNGYKKENKDSYYSIKNEEDKFDTSIDYEDGYEETNSEGIVHGAYTFIQYGNPYTVEYEASPGGGLKMRSSYAADVNGVLKNHSFFETSMKSFMAISEKGFEQTDPARIVHGSLSFKDHKGSLYTVEYESSREKGFLIKNITKHELEVPAQKETNLGKTIKSSIFPAYGNSNYASPDLVIFNMSEHQIKTNPLSISKGGSIYTVLKESKPEEIMEIVDESKLNLPSEILERPTKMYSILKKMHKLLYKADGDKHTDKNTQNASYKFGFSADGQTRDEEADTKGNVHGSYSYSDPDGFIVRVNYEAGANKGFIIKNITRHSSKSDNAGQSKCSRFSNSRNREITKNSSLNKEPFINKDNVSMKKFRVGGWSTDYTQDKEMYEIRKKDRFSTRDTDLSFDQFLQIPSNYDNNNVKIKADSLSYSMGTPKVQNINSDKPTNKAHIKTQINEGYKELKTTEERDKELPVQGPLVLFYKHLPQNVINKKPIKTENGNNNLVSNNITSLKSQKVSNGKNNNMQKPQNESYNYQTNAVNTYNKPQNSIENMFKNKFGFYYPISDTSLVTDFPEVILEISAIRRAVATSNIKSQNTTHYNNQKKIMITQPINKNPQTNFTTILTDGSYAFSYTTNDHSRQQSVDSDGNAFYAYQYQPKKDGEKVFVVHTSSVNHPL